MTVKRRRKSLLTDEERAKQLRSREEQDATCPLCGSWGEPGFTRFYCSSVSCENWDEETWKKTRAKLPPVWDDEDTQVWKP